MGWLSWITNTEKEHTKALPPWLPAPARPAPPMPLCKPPKGADISEPVVKLLEMLSKDEWELTENKSINFSQSRYLINIYKEDIRFLIFKGYSSVRYKFVSDEWMTEDERLAVNKAVNILCDLLLAEISDWQKYKSRDSFKRYLEGDNVQ
jgi:hypothetical protein